MQWNTDTKMMKIFCILIAHLLIQQFYNQILLEPIPWNILQTNNRASFVFYSSIHCWTGRIQWNFDRKISVTVNDKEIFLRNYVIDEFYNSWDA